MIDNSQKLDQIISDRKQFLAQAGAENSSSSLAAKYPTGVHYVSPSGAFRRLYEYSDQDQAETNFIFADLDFDSDSDILHSIDKEIFVKHFKNSSE